jgi:predicted acyltransferase
MRVYSIDAFRGFTMIWMFSNAFGLHHLKDVPWIAPIERQFTHAEWHGMHAWDMIQPFFMFIVGAAMPWAFEKRRAAGESESAIFRHVLRRCALLIFWGLMARSLSAGRPTLDLINVLAQLSFTYLVAYLVLDKSWRVQFGTAAGLLAVHWLFYNFVSAEGITGPYDRNANPGWWLDGVLLGKHWGGGYATINCVSSAANTIFGMMAGWVLKSGRAEAEKVRALAIWGGAGIAAGLLMGFAVPINKKIWTASFALLSTGITLWALAAFYWICDVRKKQDWAWIGMVVGANSIFIYVFHEMTHRFLERSAEAYFAWPIEWWGPWGRALATCSAVAFQIYLCVWLYRRKIFFKL